eukprot:gene14357-20354_t
MPSALGPPPAPRSQIHMLATFVCPFAQSAMARLKNADKNKPSAGSNLKKNLAGLTTVCQICRATFTYSAKEVQLRDHYENKHPKKAFAECFPEMAPPVPEA